MNCSSIRVLGTRWILLCLAVIFSSVIGNAQEFNALHFDGDDDVITLPVVPIPATELETFSVQLWYQAVNEPRFAPPRNLLRIYSGNRAVSFTAYNNSMSMTRGSTTTTANTSFTNLNQGAPDSWHHLRLDVDGDSLTVYLDCQIKARLATELSGPVTAMVLGGRGETPGFTDPHSWLGKTESYRLYTGIPRAGMNACITEYCVPNPDSNLLVHYDFNQGAAAGANQGILAVENRSSYSGLDGFLFNFALTGPTSNFVASDAPLFAEQLTNLSVEVLDYPYQNAPLTTICSGDPVQFRLVTDQLPSGALSNVDISWQTSYDDGHTWEELTLPFDGFSFPVPPGVITLDCDTSSTGNSRRLFRATLVVEDPASGNQCTYLSLPDTLFVRCPLTDVFVNVTPSAPLCGEDEVLLDIALVSTHPWLNPPVPGTTITWTVSVPGSPPEVLTNFTDEHSFSYPYIAPAFSAPQTVTFTASLEDCNGTLRQFSAGITVDPPPIPARLTGLPEISPTNLTLLTPGPNPVYDICPGNDATLGERNFFNHQFCRPRWQYTFDPASGVWQDLGFSNVEQNTNILPTSQWGSATSIYYRQICEPLSSPSGCEPAISDTLEIRLRALPTPPVITGADLVCLNDSPVTLVVSNPEPGVEYTWYRDGIPFVSATTSFATAIGGNIQVVADNGCQRVTGPVFELRERELVPVISCPLSPNECVTPGELVTLSASDSFVTNDPNSLLSYEWSATTGNLVENGTGESFSYTADPGTTSPLVATTVTLTVTEATTGCSVTTERTITPCGNRY